MNNSNQIISLLTEIRDLLKPKEPKKRGKLFVPPLYGDISVYCMDIQTNIDPQAFIDFYESKGWMVGKNKMKDWKAAVRNWSKRNGSNGQRQNTQFDNRSRAKKVSDALDEIARKDIERNGFTSELDSGSV